MTKTGGTDQPDLTHAERFWEGHRMSKRHAARIVALSIICSGLVALFIGRMIEVQIYNQQRLRNITNCGFIQADRIDARNSLNQQADSVLGNPNHKPKPIPSADFSKPPYKQFRPFKSLIIAQAVQNRKRAAKFNSRIENCNKVFPKRHTFWIF